LCEHAIARRPVKFTDSRVGERATQVFHYHVTYPSIPFTRSRLPGKGGEALVQGNIPPPRPGVGDRLVTPPPGVGDRLVTPPPGVGGRLVIPPPGEGDRLVIPPPSGGGVGRGVVWLRK
jgi:hypothetical protein